MTVNVTRRVMVAGAVGIAIVVSQAAQAATCSNPYSQITPLCLTDTVANNGTANTVTDPYGSATAVNAVSSASSYFLGDQFNPGPVSGNLTGVSGSQAWNFYDSFVFTLANVSTAEGALISFNMGPGISGIGPLQARLVQVPNGSFGTNADYDAVALNNLNGFTSPSGTTVIDAWTTDQQPPGSNIYQVALTQTALSAGEYVLQVRGVVAGSPANGSYSGTLSFVPVPLPAGFWTLLSGLGVLAAWRGLRPTGPSFGTA